MVQNEGETDRVVRTVLGVVAILIAYSVMGGVWQVVLYVFGALMLVTSFTGFCLIYKLVGFSTKKEEND